MVGNLDNNYEITNRMNSMIYVWFIMVLLRFVRIKGSQQYSQNTKPIKVSFHKVYAGKLTFRVFYGVVGF